MWEKQTHHSCKKMSNHKLQFMINNLLFHNSCRTLDSSGTQFHSKWLILNGTEPTMSTNWTVKMPKKEWKFTNAKLEIAIDPSIGHRLSKAIWSSIQVLKSSFATLVTKISFTSKILSNTWAQNITEILERMSSDSYIYQLVLHI